LARWLYDEGTQQQTMTQVKKPKKQRLKKDHNRRHPSIHKGGRLTNTSLGA
jgi:hypothetical protein